jgi:alpha-tubulin suppressor-like RCC1 family protein
VLLYDGSVECAGNNWTGNLGLGTHDEEKHPLLEPAAVLAGSQSNSVGIGAATCVLAAPSEDNKVFCFGYGRWGQLGDGIDCQNDDEAISVDPVSVQGLRQSPRIIQLALGVTAACVLYAAPVPGTTSAVQCWGDGYGLSAVDVAGTVNTTQLVVYSDRLCALMSSQTVRCWKRPAPGDVLLPSLEGVTRFALGGFRGDESVICAVVPSAASYVGSLWCWGIDNDDGLPSNSTTPWKVAGLPGNVVDVAVGHSHACALVNNGPSSGGTVYCWGKNACGQLGQGYTNGSDINPIGSHIPLRVEGLSNVTALFAMDRSNCAMTAAQRVLCWGYNTDGMLGVGISMMVITLPTAMQRLCA